MKRTLRTKLLSLLLLAGCHTVEPPGLAATVVGFDPYATICGGTWIIHVGDTDFQVRGYTNVPKHLQIPDQPVWVRFANDTVTYGQNCRFIRLLSIRAR